MDLEHDVTDKATTSALYRVILGREPDTGGLASWAGKTVAEVIRGLQSSDEFFLNQMTEGRLEDSAIEEVQVRSKPWMVNHYLRCELIRTRLPGAQRVLDLAGGHRKDPRGALLANGYPFRPKELHIVDLPSAMQRVPWPEMGQAMTWGGTSIQFHDRCTADLAEFEPDYFDLVWSGESIERITEDQAHAVFGGVKRVLRPGGIFCLATPNRHVTRIQAGPGNLAHPEHRHEYYFQEFVQVFGAHGFSLKDQCGVIHMPRSIEAGVFDLDEYKDRSLNDDPQRSYMFYLAYEKA